MTRQRLLDAAVVVGVVADRGRPRDRPRHDRRRQHDRGRDRRPRAGAGGRSARAARAGDLPAAARQPDRRDVRGARAQRRRDRADGLVLGARAATRRSARGRTTTWPPGSPNFAWVPFTTVLLCELPLRFPDGVLLSPRWRWAERLALLQIVVLSLGLAFAPGRMNSYPIDNPYPGGDALHGAPRDRLRPADRLRRPGRRRDRPALPPRDRP